MTREKTKNNFNATVSRPSISSINSEQGISALHISSTIKNYAWGKPFETSYVAKYATAEQTDHKLPYAELWIGAHPSSPSIVLDTDSSLNNISLISLIEKFPAEILGEDALNRFGKTLPFLLKILSINQALSIQSHPNIEFAKLLNAKDPKNYPDANHKPEIVVALTPMEMLNGVRTDDEILNFIKEYELQSDLKFSVGNSDKYKSLLFNTVFSLTNEHRELIITKIHSSILNKKESQTELSKHESLFLTLLDEYPNDPGLIVLFLLNIKCLNPGDAMYTGAGVPHAYLSGDAIECMATSDNTIRGGLTPKFIDKESFCESLKLNADLNFDGKVNNTSINRNVSIFIPPVEEFLIRIHKDGSEYKSILKCCEVLFCIEGDAKIETNKNSIEITKGSVILIPYSLGEYTVRVKSGMVVSVGVNF